VVVQEVGARASSSQSVAAAIGLSCEGVAANIVTRPSGVAVRADGRGGVLGKSHFLDAPDEDAVGSKMRDRLRRAKEICLGIGEIRQAAPEPPIALLEPLDAFESAAEHLQYLHMRRSKQIDAEIPRGRQLFVEGRSVIDAKRCGQGGLTGPARENRVCSRHCKRDDTATPSTYMQTSRAAGP
jgi:hypothetical protein